MRNHLGKQWRIRTHREQGAVAVEFALLFPIVFMVAIGAINGALLVEKKITVTAGAVEAAHYGSVLDHVADPDWGLKVIDVAIAGAGGESEDLRVCVSGIDIPNNDIQTWRSHGGYYETGDQPCWDDGRPDDEVRVQAEVNRDEEFEIVLAGWDVTLLGQSISANGPKTPVSTPTPTVTVSVPVPSTTGSSTPLSTP